MVNELLKSRLLKEISNPSELEIFNPESTFLLSIKIDDADEDLDTMVSSKEIEVLSVIIVGFWGRTTSFVDDSSPPQLNIKNIKLKMMKGFFIIINYFLKLFFDLSNTYSMTSLCLLSNRALLPEAGAP